MAMTSHVNCLDPKYPPKRPCLKPMFFAAGSMTFWRCRWAKQLKCKGTAKTDGFYLVSRYHTHNHSPAANPIANIYNSKYVELNLGKKEVEFKDE